VPHTSMLFQPLPSAVPEKNWVLATSDRTYRIPLALMKTFATAPFAAVRNRNSVVDVASRAATFTFALMHIEE